MALLLNCLFLWNRTVMTEGVAIYSSFMLLYVSLKKLLPYFLSCIHIVCAADSAVGSITL